MKAPAPRSTPRSTPRSLPDIDRYWRLGSLSRRSIATRIHLHWSLVARILRGERKPTIETALALAPLLKLTVETFYDRWQKLHDIARPASRPAPSHLRASKAARKAKKGAAPNPAR